MARTVCLPASLLLASLLGACAGTPAPAPEAPSETAVTAPYLAAAAAINATMRTYHYNPAELDSDAYRAIEAATLALAASSDSDEAFLEGFAALWQDGPFSHVTLQTAHGTADETAAYLDTLTVGNGAELAWQDDAAILTVHTMMGLDTIDQIDAAYAEIAAKGAGRLVIDLRGNTGGAFAVVPLVEHVLAEPLDAGVFAAQRWNADHDAPPTGADAATIDPWTGWSIRSFWADVTEAPLTRIRFEPREGAYSGPVLVLIAGKTASAAEMAADALKASGRATLIGETTAGQMLSQKMFDIPGGFQLSLPIADYYSIANGRIEGQGVTPDIAADPETALEIALSQ
ncbi:MAG: S41 family peptidase [Hyphomonas sp.]|nr:S41 family peptidase [Hyphomonas sp.]